MQIKNAQLWLDTAARLIQRDFIQPAGYEITIPPIRLGRPFVEMGPHEAGSTVYDKVTKRPSLILLSTADVFAAAFGGGIRTPRPDDMAAVLAHELAHVAASPVWGDGADGHDDPGFLSLIRAMGLEGDPHATVAGPKFLDWVDDVLLPAYLAAEKEAVNV